MIVTGWFPTLPVLVQLHAVADPADLAAGDEDEQAPSARTPGSTAAETTTVIARRMEMFPQEWSGRRKPTTPRSINASVI